MVELEENFFWKLYENICKMYFFFLQYRQEYKAELITGLNFHSFLKEWTWKGMLVKFFKYI